MQKLDVPFEICIGEDSSSDRTRSICEDYARQYPELIKLFRRNRDTVIFKDGKATGVFNFLETLKACSGEFIALLEGDDYWVDPHKLQAQLNLLRENQSWSGCGHACLIDDGALPPQKSEINDPQGFESIELLDVLSNGSQLPTASILFRRSGLFPLADWYENEPSDWKLEAALLLKGELCKLKATWSVYRIHPLGVYSGENALHQLRYRERQASDLRRIPGLGKNHILAIRRYLAHTYRQYYPAFAQENPLRATYYLLKFVQFSDMNLMVKGKHFIKIFFRILFRKEGRTIDT